MGIPVDVSELSAAGTDAIFVQRAYELILGRDPDLEGFEAACEQLCQGVPRQSFIYNLTQSEEARQGDRNFSGVWSPQSVSIPSYPMNLNCLIDISDRGTFLRNAYQTILGREPDLEGFVNFWCALETCSRQEVLTSLTNSEEAKPRKPLLTGDLANITEIREKRIGLATRVFRSVRRILARPAMQAYAATAYVHYVDQNASAALQSGMNANLDALSKRLNQVERDLRESLRSMSAVVQAASNSAERRSSRLEDLLTEAVSRLTTQIDQRAAYTLEFANRLETVRVDLDGVRQELSARIAETAARIKPPVLHVNGITVARIDPFLLAMPSHDVRLVSYLTFYGTLEKGLTERFRQTVREGMTVVDVGAHIGIYTLLGALLTGPTGRVFSFEPTPATFDILRLNLELNGFDSRVKVFQSAVSDRQGHTMLKLSQRTGLNSIFGNIEASAGSTEVDTVKLDDVLRDVGTIDVMKIDAEGAEPWILKGMHEILANNPNITIFMEFAPSNLERAGVDPGGFFDELIAQEFKIFRVDDFTSELMEAKRADLISCFSANLWMQPKHG